MAYKFTFDISKLPLALFSDTEKHSQIEGISEKIEDISRKLVKKYQLEKLTGLSINNSTILIQDIIKIHIQNRLIKKIFYRSKKRAVFLPHCCRKYMNSNCKAEFKPQTSTYICKHCSKDCMVSQATKFAKKEKYDVYVLPGSSCVSKIFKNNAYDGIIGIACTDELKLGTDCLMELNIPALGIPLIKNGCSGTKFNLQEFKSILKEIRKVNY
jgi:hypothetical protein